jgi:phosphoribosylformylglycinamidine cyclo-ligase
VIDVAGAHGISAWSAGRVESGSREVVIESLGIRYGSDALSLRS